MAHAAWHQILVTVETDPPLRLWTGPSELSLDGRAYGGGGQALGISELEQASGDPDRRLRISLSGIPKSVRSQFLQDVGPAAPGAIEALTQACEPCHSTAIP